jgi:8-oxo-dGTP diphosphatase
MEAARARRAARLALTVRAAGGVVRREGQVLVVHRPKYDDWTLPKGKCKAGESWEQCALREVEEETGFTCELGPWLGSTRYLVHGFKLKTVLYWSMTPLDGTFEPGREVDEIRWLGLDEAAEWLTHRRDVRLLSELD